MSYYNSIFEPPIITSVQILHSSSWTTKNIDKIKSQSGSIANRSDVIFGQISPNRSIAHTHQTRVLTRKQPQTIHHFFKPSSRFWRFISSRWSVSSRHKNGPHYDRAGEKANRVHPGPGLISRRPLYKCARQYGSMELKLMPNCSLFTCGYILRSFSAHLMAHRLANLLYSLRM